MSKSVLGLVFVVFIGVGCVPTHLLIVGEPEFCSLDPQQRVLDCVPFASRRSSASRHITQVVDRLDEQKASAHAEDVGDEPSISERFSLFPDPDPAVPPPALEIPPPGRSASQEQDAPRAPRRDLAGVQPAAEAAAAPSWGYFKIDSVIPVEIQVDG